MHLLTLWLSYIKYTKGCEYISFLEQGNINMGHLWTLLSLTLPFFLLVRCPCRPTKRTEVEYLDWRGCWYQPGSFTIVVKYHMAVSPPGNHWLWLNFRCAYKMHACLKTQHCVVLLLVHICTMMWGINIVNKLQWLESELISRWQSK